MNLPLMAPNLLPPLSAVRYILPLTLGLLGPLTLGLLGPRFLSGAISFPELLLPLTVSNLLSLSGKVRCLLPLILASLGRGAVDATEAGQISDSIQDWIDIASSANGTKLVAVSEFQIFTSSDSGVTWTVRL